MSYLRIKMSSRTKTDQKAIAEAIILNEIQLETVGNLKNLVEKCDLTIEYNDRNTARTSLDEEIYNLLSIVLRQEMPSPVFMEILKASGAAATNQSYSTALVNVLWFQSTQVIIKCCHAFTMCILILLRYTH